MIVKFIIDGRKEFGNDKDIEIRIGNFPERPMKGDLINLETLSWMDLLEETECNQIYATSGFKVDFCVWEEEQNKEGEIILKVFLEYEI